MFTCVVQSVEEVKSLLGGEESLSLGPDSSGHLVSPVIAVPVNTATR